MRKKFLLAATACVLVAASLVAVLYFTRTAEPDVPSQDLPKRAQGVWIMNRDLIGLSPKQAEELLGYPDAAPSASSPRIIGQDPTVDLTAPTIVTAACMINRGDPRHMSGLVVFEVANPGQVSAEELALLKKVTSADRQQHIEDLTGCPTSNLGVFVETSSR